MLIKHRGHIPVVDRSAFVAPTAVLVGRVRVGPRSRVLYDAILDAEASRVEVGECVIVGEHAVLRASAAGARDQPVLVGDHVFIGPHSTLLGCAIEAESYIATGATVLQEATVRSGGVVAVGALVHAGTVVPAEFFVPPNAIAIGDPIRLYGSDEHAALAEAIKGVGFARRAFGVDASWEDRRARYRQATEVRSREFAPHADDEIAG